MISSVPKCRGSGAFIHGRVTLLHFSAVRMVPMFASILVEPINPSRSMAKRVMRAVAVDIGPFHFDWSQVKHLLSVRYRALLFLVVALNRVAVPAVVAQGRLLAMEMCGKQADLVYFRRSNFPFRFTMFL
ncbi:MAG: hypothetical protein JNG88_14765 [Phycisphaerales bacterium]|nr:hypothetical protein [Phycisphaerales bacterium]